MDVNKKSRQAYDFFCPQKYELVSARITHEDAKERIPGRCFPNISIWVQMWNITGEKSWRCESP
jgi:hypothetical protein